MDLTLALPSKISLYYLFLNTHNELTHLSSDSYFMTENNDDEDEVTIPFSFLITKIKSFTSYQILESFLFHVDVDFTKEQDQAIFLNEETENGKETGKETGKENGKNVDKLMNEYFKPLTFLNDISFGTSTSFFHPLNSVFFVFRERPKSMLPRLFFTTEEKEWNDFSEIPTHKTRKKISIKERHTRRLF